MITLPEALGRARDVALRVAGPGADLVDAERKWPERALRALQEAGLGGLVVPAASGGLGLGLLGLSQVSEILGAECGSTALCFGMHCVGSAVLAAKATPDQRARYLVPIVEGKHLTTLSLSEPGTGAHFYLPQLRLLRDRAGQFLASGEKSFVTNGGHADSYVTSTASADPGGEVGQFSCVVIDRDAPGLAWGPEWTGMGMRGNSSRNMLVRDVPVPAHNLIGEEGDQIWYVFNVVAPYFLIAMAGTYLGIATAALGEARAHLADRRHTHSGRSLAEQPVLQHRFGTLWATVERTRQLIYSAALRFDGGDREALPAVLSAKAEVGDCVVSVVNEAMTLCGGMAYRSGSRLERHLRDARAAHVMSPTTDLLRTWTGRALLGQPMLGE